MAHALLSASGSSKWLTCPGSVAMSQGKPDSSGDSARWGTAAHELAAKCLEAYIGSPTSKMANPETYRDHAIQVEGHCYTVDDRMIEMVEVYLDVVTGLYSATGGELYVEYRVDYSETLGVPESFGTADALIVSADELIIIDLKTGQNGVDAAENTQLQLYALGALEVFGLAYDFTKVTLVIVQPPKLRGADLYETTVEDLQRFATGAAKAGQIAVSLIGSDVAEIEPHLTPGEHCSKGYCKARATCPKLRAQATLAAFETVPASPDEFADLDDAQPKALFAQASADSEWLAATLAKVDVIEDFCKAVREEAYARAMAGEQVPGFKLVQGRRGARAWTSETEATEIMKSMRLKVEEMYDFKLISPTKAEKLLKESPRRWNRVAPLIAQPDGKPVLAPESDKRPALVLDVAGGFDNLAVEDLV